MSSSSDTRIYARSPDRDSPVPKEHGFSVVEPAARTTLFPPRDPNEPAPVPAPPACAQHGPRPRFTDGGTQILSVPVLIQSAPSAEAQTRHFAVERLLSRRAELNRELEQELNREPAKEPTVLASEAGVALRTLEIQQTIETLPRPAKPRKLWIYLCMLGLLLASVAMLLYKPPKEPAPAPRAAAWPAPRPASEGAPPTRVAPPPGPEVVPNPHTTLQRAAADVIAEGRYAEALVLYRQLAESEPGNPAYAEVVQILEHRTATKLDSPEH